MEGEQSGDKRAGYGKELLKRLSSDLTAKFGRGFSQRNLEQMRLFYIGWRIPQTVSAKSHSVEAFPSGGENSPDPSSELSRPAPARRFPLPWSHYARLMTLKSEQSRGFYEAEALRGGWSVRQLDRRIGSQFYERTALSHNKAAMLRKGSEARPEDAVSPEECESAVEAILSSNDGDGVEAERHASLRLVPSRDAERKIVTPDPELKRMLDEMCRCLSAGRGRGDLNFGRKDAA